MMHRFTVLVDVMVIGPNGEVRQLSETCEVESEWWSEAAQIGVENICSVDSAMVHKYGRDNDIPQSP